MVREYDLVIIGGGTAGYVSAIRAAQLGLKTAIVEKENVGGTCLHKGCIPSKTLLRSAEVYRLCNQTKMFGVDVSDVKLRFSEVQKRKEKVVQTLYNGLKGLIQKRQVDVFEGVGRILGPSIFSPMSGTISVEMNDGSENEMLSPKNIIIATGSKPKQLNGIVVDGERIIVSDHAFEMKELPKSIIIVGGGVIGIEWASMLHDFGVQVTVVEGHQFILPNEDVEISAELEKHLRKRGIQIITNATLLTDTLEKSKDHLSIQVKTAKKHEKLSAEKLFIAVGRIGNIEGIGLENTAIKTNNHFIQVNEHYQTAEQHIYAIGDVIGGMQLAHVASFEGLCAVEYLVNGTKPSTFQHVPRCVYSYPEVASIGLSEQEAKNQGYAVKIGKMPFHAIGKALIEGDSFGFVKMIADQNTNDLLGVHMIGPHVTDMISESSLAMLLDATPWEISQTIHPHPSLSEVYQEAGFAVDGKAVHI